MADFVEASIRQGYGEPQGRTDAVAAGLKAAVDDLLRAFPRSLAETAANATAKSDFRENFRALKQSAQMLAGEGTPPSDSWLLLSGGSQNGAFGAGFMSEWARQRGGELPRFRVVTGISTGALQSTFAFIGQPSRIVEEYQIPDEGRLLKTFVK